MTTTALTLAAFIEQRLAEDEAAARAASPGPWHVDDGDPESVLAVDDIQVVDAFALSGPQTRATATHIARHDPARVLAQCAALRAVARSTSQFFDTAESLEASGERWEHLTDDHDLLTRTDYLRQRHTLRALAAIWADHEAYDPGWAL